jgi:molybdopterin synthase catalytic subunit
VSDVATPPEQGDTWCSLSSEPLPLAEAYTWAVRPDCGAVVVFSGIARDHSDGRAGVTLLEYEAYEERTVAHFEAIVSDLRVQWPDVGHVAVLHRTGPLTLGETAVVVVVSAPHRDVAFDAARACIDTVKATAPIWKREHWADGVDWARA